jgi:dihydroxy-acid dehydratase
MTRKAFENAARVLMALGGSTNAVVHLIAMAGRLGFRLPLSLFDRLSRSTPLLVNLKPSGEYLMEDFFYAGGVPALLKELAPLLDMNTLTVTGKSLGDNVRDALNHDHRVIYPLGTPWKPEGGLAVLKGSLAPNGAIIKQTAASPNLLRHRGKAVVFEGYEELEHRIDDPNLDVSEEDVIVLKNIGPKGGPGMPEWGFLPIPKKLLQKGVRDMVRISDGRMSGTAFGTIVVHVSPEACIGGPLAVVRNGDPIELDASNRLLNLAIPEGELKQRLARWKPPKPRYHRGYGWLYLQHILQAEDGCDFDFLRKRNGARTPAQTRVNNRSQK